jgi:D-glycero-alpha-D-manno-heptose-7-phosphate kinase
MPGPYSRDSRLLRIVNSVAPIRICDNGGWTDTWFARYGRVFNIAVYPYAEVQMRVYEHRGERARITINAENYGERYTIAEPNGVYDKHPLLEAAIDYMGAPRDVALEISIFSEAPSGCSTGTSAAVSVALIGALDGLTPGRMTPHEVAMAAQKIETELLRQQCGIQDQIASAYGGINYIEMYEYPHASVSQVRVPDSIWWELESRLALIFLGQAHSSSDTHKLVIRELEDAGPEAAKLRPLRLTAEKSKDALYAGDFEALGRAMIENTEAQAALHPALVGPDHQRIIDLARAHGAAGWKVNGAGGAGGSVTLLSRSDRTVKRAMLREIEASEAKYQNIPIYLSRFGLRVWEAAARTAQA